MMGLSVNRSALPFNCRAISLLRGDRLYRVYCGQDAIRFIRIGGQGGLAFALESQGGFLGRLIANRIRTREESKRRQVELEADAFDPEFLVSQHRHNLRLVPGEILDGHWRPAGRPVHGPHFGRLDLTLRKSPHLRLQFESESDLALALEQLSHVLGDRLSGTPQGET